MNNWPDNLPMTNRNCSCLCYVTTQIIFAVSYTHSDAADDLTRVDLGGRRIIKNVHR